MVFVQCQSLLVPKHPNTFAQLKGPYELSLCSAFPVLVNQCVCVISKIALLGLQHVYYLLSGQPSLICILRTCSAYEIWFHLLIGNDCLMSVTHTSHTLQPGCYLFPLASKTLGSVNVAPSQHGPHCWVVEFLSLVSLARTLRGQGFSSLPLSIPVSAAIQVCRSQSISAKLN